MPLAITCPSCRARCRVPESSAGRQVRCPKCDALIPVPEPEPIAEDEVAEAVDDDAPAARRSSARRKARRDGRRERPEKKSSTALVVGFVVCGMLLIVLMIGGAVAAFLVMAKNAVQKEQDRISRAMEDADKQMRGLDDQFGREQDRLLDRQKQLDEEKRDEQRRLEEAERQAKRMIDGIGQDLGKALGEPDPSPRKPVPRNKRLAEVTIPTAVTGKGSAAGAKAREANLSWTTVQATEPAVGVVWAADGKSFYVLTRSGLLRQIGYPDLKEQGRITLKQECSALGLCRIGLMLTLPQLQEIWMLDPDTFTVKWRLGVSQLVQALSAPNLTVAYAFCRPGDGSQRDNLPVRVNLADGSITEMTLAATGGAPGFLTPSGFDYPALSPDGRSLFAEGGKLIRYGIKGTTLTLDASTQAGMGGGHKEGICISPDSRLVCFPTEGGNDGAKYGTHVYRTDDLSRPAFTLNQGMYPEVVGFDPISKRLFGQNNESALLVFDQNGTLRGEYKLAAAGGTRKVKQYAAHPINGRAVLLRTSDQLLLIDLGG